MIVSSKIKKKKLYSNAASCEILCILALGGKFNSCTVRTSHAQLSVPFA